MEINRISLFVFKSIRKIIRAIGLSKNCSGQQDFSGVQFFNEEANDKVYELLATNRPCMISKFGTTELSNIVSKLISDNGLNISIIKEYLFNNLTIEYSSANISLKNNSGFFPNTTALCDRFVDENLAILGEIDILGSYIKSEKYIEKYLSPNCIKINLDGYYAPFLWDNPWTRILEGKRVLVIHPFTESIAEQYYNNREKLFKNPRVLPKFKELLLIKAVQSLGGENNEFANWFEALDFMKRQIDKHEFDIALIGCGAYGMPLAAYIKQTGHQAVHLAGWTQMLFGIYGKRWLEDQPEYKDLINEHWIRPNKTETPPAASKVEGGCYW